MKKITCLHDLPTEATFYIHDLPYDPIVGWLGHRWDAADGVLRWLHDNGWKVTPPE